jgi:uncharacterized protein YqgQ
LETLKGSDFLTTHSIFKKLKTINFYYVKDELNSMYEDKLLDRKKMVTGSRVLNQWKLCSKNKKQDKLSQEVK